MVTTIQISETLRKELKEKKLHDNESYEEVIWDLIEDTSEISKETKAELEKARKEIKEGKYVTLQQLWEEIEG